MLWTLWLTVFLILLEIVIVTTLIPNILAVLIVFPISLLTVAKIADWERFGWRDMWS